MKKYKFLSIALTVFMTAATHADDLFKNTEFGIELIKPTNWEYVSHTEILDSEKNTRLADKDLKKRMIQISRAPLVAMVSHQAVDKSDATFKIQVLPLDDLKDKDLRIFLRQLSEKMKQSYKDFVLIQQPANSILSGLKSVDMIGSFSFQTEDGRSFPVLSHMWLVPRGGLFFMIAASADKSDEKTIQIALPKIISSIKITP